MFYSLAGPSLQVIEDEFNMISFYRERDETVFGVADESTDEISISDYVSEQTLSDDDDDEDDEEPIWFKKVMKHNERFIFHYSCLVYVY